MKETNDPKLKESIREYMKANGLKGRKNYPGNISEQFGITENEARQIRKEIIDDEDKEKKVKNVGKQWPLTPKKVKKKGK